MSFCFLRTMKTVSPSSGTLDTTNIQVQNPLTRSRSMKLEIGWWGRKLSGRELPRHTERVVDAVSGEGEDELRQGPGHQNNHHHHQHQNRHHIIILIITWPPQQYWRWTGGDSRQSEVSSTWRVPWDQRRQLWPDISCWLLNLFATYISLTFLHWTVTRVTASPVGHEMLSPKYDEEVDSTGPAAHGLPVLLHPHPVLWVLEFLEQRLTCHIVTVSADLLKVEHVGIVPPLTRHLHLEDVVLYRDCGEDRGHPLPWSWPWSYHRMVMGGWVSLWDKWFLFKILF